MARGSNVRLVRNNKGELSLKRIYNCKKCKTNSPFLNSASYLEKELKEFDGCLTAEQLMVAMSKRIALWDWDSLK